MGWGLTTDSFNSYGGDYTIFHLSLIHISVNGLGCLREWVNPETMEESMVNVGDECELFYNRWGRIDHISVIS